MCGVCVGGGGGGGGEARGRKKTRSVLVSLFSVICHREVKFRKRSGRPYLVLCVSVAVKMQATHVLSLSPFFRVR